MVALLTLMRLDQVQTGDKLLWDLEVADHFGLKHATMGVYL